MKLRAYLSASQSIPSKAETLLQLDAETFDTEATFDPTTHRFTPTKPGYYLILATVTWYPATAGRPYDTRIKKNGITIAYGTQVPAADNTAPRVLAHDLAYLAVDDYIELYVYQGTPVAQNVYGGEDSTFLVIFSVA